MMRQQFMNRLRSWLAPPVFPYAEEKTRQAYLVNLMLQAGVVFIVATLFILPWISTASNFGRFLGATMTVLASVFISKVFLNRGQVQAAGFLLSTVIWLTFVVITVIEPEGLFGTPFLGAVALAPLIAGFVSGTRSSIVITVLNWLLGGFLVWLEISGRLPIIVDYNPLSRFLALMIMFSAFPLLIYIWRRNFDEAIEQVRVVKQAQQETAVYRLQNEALEMVASERTNALEASLLREQQLAEKLSVALEQETQIGALQSRIITVVSHEFRTPLSVIHSSAELLQYYYDKLPQERRDAVHLRIRDSIFYLHNLLKDITLVDRAQRKQIQPSYRKVTFSALCQQLSETLFREVNQPERITLQFVQNIETTMQTDVTLLSQIFANLVSNALKYSAEDEPVQVQFWLDGPQFVLEVADQGIGIPVYEQEKVFELFYRASNVDERRGLGLGLFIVQAICQMMEGTVQVNSGGRGQGAIFIVRLPLMPNASIVNNFQSDLI